jgi:hypothetical protein
MCAAITSNVVAALALGSPFHPSYGWQFCELTLPSQ